MTIIWVLNRMLWILALSSVIAVVMWLNGFDRKVTQAAHEQYCADVAQWMFEERRGIPPEIRTGAPDYNGIAEEHCPGLRPAELARN